MSSDPIPSSPSRPAAPRSPSGRGVRQAAAAFRWVTLLGLAVAVACATNPVTGQRELMLLSEGQEIQLGRDNDPAIVAQYGVYEDEELSAWVAEVASGMAANSERPDLPWTFRVLDDPVVNAFALPGGFIYMTRGILAHMSSEAEAVGVLGHEIGHVTARHGAQRYTSASIAQIGLGVGSILSEDVRAMSGILQTGVGLLFLKFGRDDETQSDELGVRYSVRAGYDPRALAAFFRTIERMSDAGGGRLPTWLSTHPAPQDRVGKVLAEAEPLVAGRSDLQVNRDPHMRRIDGIVYGSNPREGVIVDGTFKHPDLLFQIDFPAGWQVQNTKSAVVSAPEAGDAVVGLMASPMEGGDLRGHVDAAMRAREATGIRGGATRLAGSPAYRVTYRATSNGIQVQAQDVFVQYGELVYDLIGYSRPNAFSGFAPVIDRWQRSFRPLPRSEADRYQPDRLEVFAAPRTGTLESMVDPGPAADITALLLLNGMAADTRVERGTLIKRVRAGYQR